MTIKYFFRLIYLLLIIILFSIQVTYGQDELEPEPALVGDQALDEFVYLPLINNPLSPALVPPYIGTSYYIQDISDQAMLDLGCQIGNDADVSNTVYFVFLHFGQPTVEVKEEIIDGQTVKVETFGVVKFGTSTTANEFVSLEKVQSAIDKLATEFTMCSEQASDTPPILRLAIGLNNDGDHVTIEHGAKWGTLVEQVNSDISEGASRSRIQVVGATDAELGFNGPTETRAWVDGYHSTSSILYNVGTADGCPSSTTPNFTCGTQEFPSWAVEDVIYLSNGRRGSRVVPQIYDVFGDNSRQWTYLAKEIDENGLFPFRLLGPLSQYEACQQRGGCDNIDNKPEQSFLQLAFELIQEATFPKKLEFVSDIQWQIE